MSMIKYMKNGNLLMQNFIHTNLLKILLTFVIFYIKKDINMLLVNPQHILAHLNYMLIFKIIAIFHFYQKMYIIVLNIMKLMGLDTLI